MFQWDAVDTSPDLGGVKLAIRFNEQTARTELDRVFCRWIYFHLRSKIFFWPSYAGGGAIASIAALCIHHYLRQSL